MDTKNSFLGIIHQQLLRKWICLPLCLLVTPAVVQGQVRSKKPDRPVYQPRIISPMPAAEVPSAEVAGSRQTEFAFREFSRVKTRTRDNATSISSGTESRQEPTDLVDTQLDDQTVSSGIPPLSKLQPLPLADLESALPIAGQSQHRSAIQQVGNTEIKLIPPKPVQINSTDSSAGEFDLSEPIVMESLSALHDATCDGCDGCGNNDLWSCDSMCCDGIDCRCGGTLHSLVTNHFRSDRWFATAELMLMWRKGDRLPPLVTTGPTIDICHRWRIG